MAGCCASVDQLKENGLALLRHVSSWWVGTTLSTPTGGTSVLSKERFVGLKSGISLMHEVLMQTIRPRSWDKRKMGAWCMFPRNWRIQSWKAWLRIPHCAIVHQGIWSHSTRPVSIMRGVRDCHRSGSRLCKDDAGIVQADIAGGIAWCRVDHWAMDRPGWGRDLEGMHWQQSHIVHGRILSWWRLGKVIQRHLDLMGGLGSLLRWAEFGLGARLG